MRKDYEKLDNEQQKQGIAFQKYKTLAKIAQEKHKKLSGTLDEVNNWLGELKGVANYDEAASSTRVIPLLAGGICEGSTRTRLLHKGEQQSPPGPTAPRRKTMRCCVVCAFFVL